MKYKSNGRLLALCIADGVLKTDNKLRLFFNTLSFHQRVDMHLYLFKRNDEIYLGYSILGAPISSDEFIFVDLFKADGQFITVNFRNFEFVDDLLTQIDDGLLYRWDYNQNEIQYFCATD